MSGHFSVQISWSYKLMTNAAVFFFLGGYVLHDNQIIIITENEQMHRSVLN